MAAHEPPGGDPLRVGGWVAGTPGGPGGDGTVPDGAGGSAVGPGGPGAAVGGPGVGAGRPGYDTATGTGDPRWWVESGALDGPPVSRAERRAEAALRRQRRLVAITTVIRDAAPPGGYLAAVGRYVYQGRRFRQMLSTPRRRTAVAVVTGLSLIAVVLGANIILRGDPAGDEPGPPSADGPIIWPPVGGDFPTTSAPAPTPTSAAPPQVPSQTPPQAPPPTAATPTPTPRPSRTPGEQSFEAETARLFGAAEVSNLNGASGGKLVSNIGTRQQRGNQASSGVIQFAGISVSRTTRYALTVFYVTGEARTAVMLINGGQSQTLDFPSSGGFDRVRSVTFTIELTTGANIITFGNPTAFAPRMDRITVYG